MPTPKDAYRQAMRADLLTAAQTVIARKGLSGFTIRDVLAEAGVAPGTLYAYFEGGKDDLLASLAQELAEVRISETAASLDDAQAAALFWALLTDGFAHPDEGASLLADLRGRPAGEGDADAVRRLNRELVAGIRPLLAQVRETGALAIGDIDAFAELLDIVWDGLARRSGSTSFVTSYERVGAVMLALVRAQAPAAVPPPKGAGLR
jgi:AcrR family transcriptional regulator